LDKLRSLLSVEFFSRNHLLPVLPPIQKISEISTIIYREFYFLSRFFFGVTDARSDCLLLDVGGCFSASSDRYQLGADRFRAAGIQVFDYVTGIEEVNATAAVDV
jgi:hypothetical protein